MHVEACDCMNRDQYLSDLYACVDRLRIPVGCTTELNHLGHQFLQKLFDKYDEVSAHTDGPDPLTNFACLESFIGSMIVCLLLQDKDSALSPAELKNLFSVLPYMPWGPAVYSNVPLTDESYISHHGYFCQWM